MRKTLGWLGLCGALALSSTSALPVLAAPVSIPAIPPVQVAQVGQVSGEITDSTGGRLPAATVTLNSVERGFSRTTTTDETGRFLFSLVSLGTYDITIALPGFQSKRITGNLYQHDVVVKYEIENLKKQPVTLDVAENLRHLRNEVRPDTGRDVEWQLRDDTTFEGGPDKERSTFEQLVFHANLPAADAKGKAEKIVHKLHLTLKNEW